MFFAAQAVATIDWRLVLQATVSRVEVLAGFFKRHVNSFVIPNFGQAFAEWLDVRVCSKIGTGTLNLRIYPGTSLGAVGVLQPAVRVRDPGTVIVVHYVPGPGRGIREALGVEALVTAKRQGILEEVLACLSDADQMPFRDYIAMLVQTHIVHAHRRWEEMGLVAQTLRETGVDPLMTEAIERSHRRTVDAGIAPANGQVPSLDDALTILSEKVIRGV